MAHRKTRRIYEKSLTYEKVYRAWDTVSHTCKNRRGVFEFGLFAHVRVARILKTLERRDYWPDKYRCFMIFEPKARLVMSQSIKDKVVNHFVANEYLIPILDQTLIDTNVATRKNMGAKAAHKMMRRYIAQMQELRPGVPIFVMKIDVSKYFYTIDHGVLMGMLRRRIKDENVLELVERIISETDKPYINKLIDKFNGRYGTDIPHYEKGKGLSIGAVTSQFLAIFYLNDVDRKIKEIYKCRWYIRYMDDLVILGWDKAELKRLMRLVEQDLAAVKLKMNLKSAVYNLCSQTGVPFLGYRYYVDGRGRLRVRCLARTVRRIRRRLRLLMRYDFVKYERAYEAYRGYFRHAYPSREIEELVGE